MAVSIVASAGRVAVTLRGKLVRGILDFNTTHGNRQGPKTTFRFPHFIVLSIPDARGTPGLVHTHIHRSIARLGD